MNKHLVVGAYGMLRTARRFKTGTAFLKVVPVLIYAVAGVFAQGLGRILPRCVAEKGAVFVNMTDVIFTVRVPVPTHMKRLLKVGTALIFNKPL
jgi:hypothetical protein